MFTFVSEFVTLCAGDVYISWLQTDNFFDHT